MAATQQNATHSRTYRQARRSYSRRLAARVPSFKLHIPFIRTLRTNVRSGVGVPTRVIQNVSVGIQPTGAHTKQTILRNCGKSFVPARTDSKDFLRGSNCENKRGRWQSPLCLHFFLVDSHVALLLGMTFEAVAITATPFEQISLLPKATISRTLCVHITYLAVAARVPSLKLHIPCISTL